MKLLSLLKNNKEIVTIITLPLVFFSQILFSPNKIIFNFFSDIPLYLIRENFLVNSIHSTGTIPLWSNYMFSGSPFLADPSSEIFYPFNIVYFLFPVEKAFGYLFIIDFILLGIFTYLFCRLIKLDKYSSLVSAVICVFGEIFTIQIFPGHIDIFNTIIWLPALLFTFEFAIQKKNISITIVSVFIISLMIFAGFIQSIAYVFISTFVYFLLRLVFENKISLLKKVKLVFIPLITFSVGILLSAIQLSPTLELAGQSIRHNGIDYAIASQFALQPYQIISAIFPYFFGSQLDSTWWAKGNMETGCIYMGISAFFLALIALLKVRNKYVTSFFLILTLALIYSFGDKGLLFKFFYDFIPGFKSFRAPGRFLFIYGFSLSVLAGFGVNYLLNKIDKFKLTKKKTIIITGYILFLLILLFTIISPSGFNLYNNYVLANQFAIAQNHTLIYSHFKNDIYLFSFLTFCLLLIFILKIRGVINITYLKILLFLLIIFDLWFFDYPYLKTVNTNTAHQTSAVLTFIKNDKDRFRIFDLTRKTILLSPNAGLETITGYNPTYLYTYQDFLLQEKSHKNYPYEPFFLFNNTDNLNILRLLNVKYIISDQKLSTQGVTKKYEKGDNIIYRLNNTLPRAFFVPETKPEISLNKLDPISEIKIMKYLPNEIDFNLKSNNSGLAVLSEIWYPGWKVYDNGIEKKLLKADNIFRAIYLKKGTHNIAFIYKPLSLKLGIIISIGTLIFLLTCSLLYLRQYLFTFFRKHQLYLPHLLLRNK